jgi:glycerol dehydrogenase
MGDAIATVFEARACAVGHVANMRGGASTRTALALAELCYRTLLEDGTAALGAARAHAVTPAFESVVEAITLLSGLDFESSGLAAAHSVHNGLTAAAGTRSFLHGEMVAFGTLVQLALERRGPEVVEEVLRFSVSVGLPVTLREIGLPDPDRSLLEAVAARATAPGEAVHNEPFPVTVESVVAAIQEADAAGRAFRASTAEGEGVRLSATASSGKGGTRPSPAGTVVGIDGASGAGRVAPPPGSTVGSAARVLW